MAWLPGWLVPVLLAIAGCHALAPYAATVEPPRPIPGGGVGGGALAGHLYVHVIDAAGRPVPGVAVVVDAGTTKLRAETDATGLAAFHDPELRGAVDVTSLHDPTVRTLLGLRSAQLTIKAMEPLLTQTYNGTVANWPELDAASGGTLLGRVLLVRDQIGEESALNALGSIAVVDGDGNFALQVPASPRRFGLVVLGLTGSSVSHAAVELELTASERVAVHLEPLTDQIAFTVPARPPGTKTMIAAAFVQLEQGIAPLWPRLVIEPDSAEITMPVPALAAVPSSRHYGLAVYAGAGAEQNKIPGAGSLWVAPKVAANEEVSPPAMLALPRELSFARRGEVVDIGYLAPEGTALSSAAIWKAGRDAPAWIIIPLGHGQPVSLSANTSEVPSDALTGALHLVVMAIAIPDFDPAAFTLPAIGRTFTRSSINHAAF